MPSLVGNKPNQVQTNGDLRTMVYMEQEQFLALAGAQTVTGAKTFSEIITASKGVAFPATQVASADANTLDDYEEGTWTPSVQGVTGTYSLQSGNYTKVGILVVASAAIAFSSISSADGTQLQINGFPFAADSTGIFYTGSFGNYQLIDLDASTVQVAWNIGSGQSSSALRVMKDNATFDTLANTNIAANTTMYITWTYRVA